MRLNFAELYERFSWTAIKNCPGRYVLSHPSDRMALDEILSQVMSQSVHHSRYATDPVHVAAFATGGLISFEKPDGSFVHTLNSKDGFQRKLKQLEIPIIHDANDE